ncbi:unnamed protein product [Penicillium camemberti]|uniref:Str. FM013 n=1 Tax=Penicillium camemberti (strain FM 013) TaxID=1429867 RepID=A0A0G4PE09_PENC3|nr:unnamed protein product [Penicillium camemberti]
MYGVLDGVPPNSNSPADDPRTGSRSPKLGSAQPKLRGYMRKKVGKYQYRDFSTRMWARIQ